MGSADCTHADAQFVCNRSPGRAGVTQGPDSVYAGAVGQRVRGFDEGAFAEPARLQTTITPKRTPAFRMLLTKRFCYHADCDILAICLVEYEAAAPNLPALSVAWSSWRVRPGRCGEGGGVVAIIAPNSLGARRPNLSVVRIILCGRVDKGLLTRRVTSQSGLPQAECGSTVGS